MSTTPSSARRSDGSATRVRFHLVRAALFVLILALPYLLEACGWGSDDVAETRLANDEQISLLPSQEVGFGAAGRFLVGHDGSANYAIPLLVPDGRRGMQPSLSLLYNSNAGDSGLGVGWTLTGGSSIARCRRIRALDGAPSRLEYDDADALCLDGRRLVLVDGAAAKDGARYRPQRNGHELVVLHGDLGHESSWFEVWLPDGGRLEYGNGEGGNALVRGERFAADAAGGAVALGEATKRWLISRRTDIAGNFLTYQYLHDTHVSAAGRIGYETLLDSIRYTGHATLGQGDRRIHFEYRPSLAERQNTYDNGFWETSSRLLQRVWMETPDDGLVTRSYELSHSISPTTGRPLLDQVDLCDGTGACLAPTRFSYTSNAESAVQFGVSSLGEIPFGWHPEDVVGSAHGDHCSGSWDSPLLVADIDGSG